MEQSTRSVEFWSAAGHAGYRVIFFREESETMYAWYGTRAECEALAQGPEPRDSEFYPAPWTIEAD